MYRMAAVLTLSAVMLGSCGAPKHIETAQETAPAATSTASDTQTETESTAPSATETEVSLEASAPDDEEELTNPPAPWLEEDVPDADTPEANETDTVPVMPDDMEAPPMPEVRE